jgi:histidinol-phosphatase (PHP family)
MGLSELGFSDHNPMPEDDFDDWRMKASELDIYVQKVERARQEFPNLSIKLGLEVDYLPGYEEWIRELAGRHSWDYFIGSVHYISPPWAIDNPNQMSERFIPARRSCAWPKLPEYRSLSALMLTQPLKLG